MLVNGRDGYGVSAYEPGYHASRELGAGACSGRAHAPGPHRTRSPSKVAAPVNEDAWLLVGGWALSVRGPGRRRMYSVTYPSATTSVERTTASERDVIIVPRITCERGPDRMSGHLAKKGCAWLGQERQQAPYAPRHSGQDAGGRTRLPSPPWARISAWIRLGSVFARFRVTGCK